jgi:hypothetical protein
MFSSPCSNPNKMASTCYESPIATIDEDDLCKNHRSLRSHGTAATANSDESYASSEASGKVRRSFQRSLTDQEYNLFLDFLESPSSTEGCIPDQIDTNDEYQMFLDFLRSPSSNSADAHEDLTPPSIHRVSADEKDLDFDMMLQHTSRSQSHVHLFEAASSSRESTPKKGMTRSQSTQSMSSTMALGALAALLGSRSPSVPFNEKKNRVKNLWLDDSDDSAHDGDIISLPDDSAHDNNIISQPDSDDIFFDDGSSCDSIPWWEFK